MRYMPLLLLLSSALASAPAFAAAPAQHQETESGARLRALYTREWAWRQKQLATDENDAQGVRPDLPDVSPAAQEARLAYWTPVLAELDTILPGTLSPDEREDHAIFRAQIEALVAQQKFRDYEKPLNADTSFWGDLTYTARRPFVRGEPDYRSFIAQMNAFPRYFRQHIANMKQGAKRGFTPPRITLEGRDATVATIAEAGRAEDTVYWEPFKSMPAAIPAQTQAELRDAARRAIATAVIPAHRELLAFLRTEYVPHAVTALPATALPDGRAYYQSKIKEFTTLDLTADEIHAIGLAEVAAIRARMEDIVREVQFKGDLPTFLAFLRSDPRFYATTPHQLLAEAAYIAKQFDAKTPLWFGRLPRARFAITPVPDDVAPFYTGGRGGPGIYLLNTYNLPSRPLYSLRALTLHESAPGHALQMSFAEENKGRPDFRRHAYISAYGEGWALYCEKLGVEMGMYETPYDRFGMLSYQMWRAARLVVDTGIHAKGWSREQGQRFLHDNTALADHEIETEVDRYISWPGQALSYYLGEMAIEKARAKAAKALGSAFDIRAFHDVVLDLGSVPLPVLEARIDRFIAEGGKSPFAEDR